MQRSDRAPIMKILVLSDIHGNLPALEAVLAFEPAVSECWFLGDIVDYGPYPRECIRLVKPMMKSGVTGNHDFAISHNADCGCRGDFKVYSEETRAWHKTLLDSGDFDFLRSLPRTAQFTTDARVFRLAHATPQGDLYSYVSAKDIDPYVEGITADFILLGHTHEQYMKTVGSTTVINPGSVGLARDGGGACYAVIEGGRPLLRRIPYDVERTIQAIDQSPISPSSKAGLAAILRGHP
jgi:putative phosphoesterase